MNKSKINPLSVTVLIFSILFSNLLFLSACSDSTSEKFEISEAKKVFPDIKTYSFGKSREPLVRLHDFVKLSLVLPENKILLEKEMITFLQNDATFEGKQYVCEQLSIIGSGESVPVLAGMLKNEETADIALYALERIESSAADDALIKALNEAEGKIKTAVINSLGQKKSAASVNKLGELLSGDNMHIASVSAAALGKIANDEAFNILKSAKSAAKGDLYDRILDSYLLCADNFLKQGNKTQAVSVYQELYSGKEPVRIRAAALKGLILSDKDHALELIYKSLKNDEPELQSVAAGMVRILPDGTDLKKIFTQCPKLSKWGQVQLLSAFADRGETSARNTVLKAVKHKNESVRIAALNSISKIGNESDVDLLIRAASGKKGIERDAARRSLYLLPGTSVDEKIIAEIPKADTNTKVELVRSLGSRNVLTAVKTLIKTAADQERSVRRESMKALAIVAAPENMNEVIQLLIKEDKNDVRKEAEKSIVAIAKKIQAEDQRAGPVLEVLPSIDKTESKGSLIKVLGQIGDKTALPVLKEYLSDKNSDFQEAAIHALSAWYDAGPADDLFEVAKTTDNETNKILALRGYVTLLLIKNDRTDNESLGLYFKAMGLAENISEKRLVLSGFATLRSMEALETTSGYLGDIQIQPEAEAAVFRIANRIKDPDKEKVKEILNKILKNTKNSNLRSRVERKLEAMK